MAGLSGWDINVLTTTLDRALQLEKTGVESLKDIFVSKPELTVSPSNNCPYNCGHCVSNSLPNGEMMDYEKMVNVPEEFLALFTQVNYGRKGNPLGYSSRGKDLVDLMNIFYQAGVMQQTIAAPVFGRHLPIIDRIYEFSKSSGTRIESMLTYHHYWKEFNPQLFAKRFNRSLHELLSVSEEVDISLLGDEFSTLSKMTEVVQSFYDSWSQIFNGLSLVPDEETSKHFGGRLTKVQSLMEDYLHFSVEYMGKVRQIEVRPVNSVVCAEGRFLNWLQNIGSVEDYVRQLDASLGEYVCPDLIKWPAIIVEPNGDLNLCGSFEAINCQKAVVSNLFKPFEEVRRELFAYSARERRWFIHNLKGICGGTVSTCRLRTRY